MKKNIKETVSTGGIADFTVNALPAYEPRKNKKPKVTKMKKNGHSEEDDKKTLSERIDHRINEEATESQKGVTETPVFLFDDGGEKRLVFGRGIDDAQEMLGTSTRPETFHLRLPQELSRIDVAQKLGSGEMVVYIVADGKLAAARPEEKVGRRLYVDDIVAEEGVPTKNIILEEIFTENCGACTPKKRKDKKEEIDEGCDECEKHKEELEEDAYNDNYELNMDVRSRASKPSPDGKVVKKKLGRGENVELGRVLEERGSEFVVISEEIQTDGSPYCLLQEVLYPITLSEETRDRVALRCGCVIRENMSRNEIEEAISHVASFAEIKKNKECWDDVLEAEMWADELKESIK